MKKLFILFVLMFIISCSNKNKIVGKREDVFLSNIVKIELIDKKANIFLSKEETFKNYYGDSSILNSKIKNYKVNNFDFAEKKISRKRFGVKNYYFSSPVVVDDVLYLLDTRGNLLAKSLDNLDKNLWKVKVIERDNFINYYGGKISYADKVLYITTRLNEVIAVNIDGNIKWRKQINAIPISNPIIENQTLYVITNDNKLYAMNTEDGQIKWIHYGNEKDSTIFGSANPVIYNNYIIASYSSGELFVINKNTGEAVFDTNLTGKYLIFSNFELTDIDSTPQIENDILIATANNGITIGLDLKNLKVLWKQNLPSLTNIILDNGFAYLITTDNILVNLNLKNGTINYYTQLPRFINEKKQKGIIYYKSIILANGKLLAFNNLNEYKIINPLNGKVEKIEKIKFNFYSKPFSLNNKLFGVGFMGRKLKIFY